MAEFNPLIWWRYPPFRRHEWAQRAMVLMWLLMCANLVTAAAVFWLARDQPARARAIAPVQQLDASWLSPPHIVDGTVVANAAAGSTPALVLKNGVEVARIPAGKTARIVEPASPAPVVWRLANAGTVNGESWTWPEFNQPPIKQFSDRRGVALTFDGGASANMLSGILRDLRSHRVRSTFFLTGQFIQRFPEKVRRIILGGHEVANHTFSHPHLTTFDSNSRHNTREGVTRDFLQLELLRTEYSFARLVGQPMAPFWRAPFGETNAQIEQWAGELGYRHVGWTTGHDRSQSFDTLDWVVDPADPLYVSGAEMAERVVDLAAARPNRGIIVLMHVGVDRRSDRVQDHLPRLIDGLQSHKLPVLTVSELLASGPTPDRDVAVADPGATD